MIPDIIREKVKQAALSMIKAYRYAISPMLGQHCRYYPSCSGYAYLAIERFGLVRGMWLGLKRLLRCHPWHEGGYDPVPDLNPVNQQHQHTHRCDHTHDSDQQVKQ